MSSPDVSLGTFLRARRRATDPESVRLGPSGPRRVQGLRREEVARLAGMSVDYYARLERGQQTAASESVLTAIAKVLNLNETECQHLLDITRPAWGALREPKTGAQYACPSLSRMMNHLPADSPGVLLGRRTDVLAANEAARAVIADFYAAPAPERNLARWFFVEDESHAFENWDAVATDIAGTLRMEMGRYPRDPRLVSLVNDLQERSRPFRDLWKAYSVALRFPERKTIRHPVAGILHFDVEAFSTPYDPTQTLYVFRPRPGSSAAVSSLISGWQPASRR